MRFTPLIGTVLASMAFTSCSSAIQAPAPLSQDDYAAIRDDMVEIANRDDPKEALKALRAKTQELPRVVSVCHALVHEIGNAAYDRYGSFPKAMEYQDGLCNSGYMHGIIERMLGSSPGALADLPSLCGAYREGSLLAWQCHHGIGHGLMFVHENDLPKALEGCGALKNKDASDTCRNGAFMENFSVDDAIHRSRYVSAETPRFPCAEQADDDKGDCYLYVPTYFLGKHPGSYAKALDWCLDSETEWRWACIMGVGSETMKQNIDNPDLVQRACAEAGDFKRECMAGAVDLAMRHYGNLPDALAFCGTLRGSNRDLCREMVQNGKAMFE